MSLPGLVFMSAPVREQFDHSKIKGTQCVPVGSDKVSQEDNTGKQPATPKLAITGNEAKE